MLASQHELCKWGNGSWGHASDGAFRFERCMVSSTMRRHALRMSIGWQPSANAIHGGTECSCCLKRNEADWDWSALAPQHDIPNVELPCLEIRRVPVHVDVSLSKHSEAHFNNKRDTRMTGSAWDSLSPRWTLLSGVGAQYSVRGGERGFEPGRRLADDGRCVVLSEFNAGRSCTGGAEVLSTLCCLLMVICLFDLFIFRFSNSILHHRSRKG